MRHWRNILITMLLAVLPAVALADDAPISLLAQGRVDQAIASLQGQLSNVPNDAESHHLLCRSYFALGAWDRAIAECERATQTRSPEEQLPSLAGAGLWREGRFREFFDGSRLGQESSDRV